MQGSHLNSVLQIIIIIDPDCIFLTPLEIIVDVGSPIAQVSSSVRIP